MPEIINLPPEIKQKYSLGRKLGSGACGEVRMIFTKDGNQRLAIKTIQKCDFSINGNINPLNDPEKIKNEIEILRTLKHVSPVNLCCLMSSCIILILIGILVSEFYNSNEGYL